MNKLQNANATTQTQEEFDRSICMSFFDDHRKLVKRIERMQGIEMAYKVQNLIIDYGLDGVMPTDEELLQFVPEPVLNQIDNNQKRRSKGFQGENLDLSRSIIIFHRDHPELSQNAIAKQLGVSKGKVNKTLQKYRNGEYEEIIDLDNINTITNTITSTSTNTGLTDDQRDRLTTCSTELANAQTEAATLPEKREREESKRTKRVLEDLSDEELVNLYNDFLREVPYVEMQKKYNISKEVTNAKLGDNIKAIQKERQEEKERIEEKERESKLEAELLKHPDKKHKLMNFTECKTDNMLFECIKDINRNIDDIITFYEDNIETKNEHDEPSFTRWTWKKRESGHFSTYERYIQEVMDSNGYSKQPA